MEDFKRAVEIANISSELKKLLKDSAQEEATEILFTLVPATFNINYDWLYSKLPQNQLCYETIL